MGKTSKAEDIYAYIKDQILSGRWKPKDRINDKELAEEIQVSRLSVREALFKLTETGIIAKEYWKGYYIKEITDDLISNMIEIRIALEKYALKHFITEASDKDIEDLHSILLESQKDLQQNDFLKYLKTDFSFHELIYTRQHNYFITSTMNNYQLTIHFIRFASMGKDKDFIDTAQNSIEWHTKIYNAIKERNTKKAEKLLVLHLSSHKVKAEREIHDNKSENK